MPFKSRLIYIPTCQFHQAHSFIDYIQYLGERNQRVINYLGYRNSLLYYFYMASREEAPTSANTYIGIADICGMDTCSQTPHLVQSATKSSIATSIPFLTLPREVRDIIYRYLLSTKYTKYVSTYARDEYCFHPLILRASRQIEREASHILYNENSLVRVSMCDLHFWVNPLDHRGARPDNIGTFCGHRISILAAFQQAHKFRRHIMEFTMLQGYTPSDLFNLTENSIIIAGEDLPKFCHILLEIHAHWQGWLGQRTLAIEFFSERAAAIAVPYERNDAMIGGEGFLRGNRSIETTTSTKDHGLNHGGMPIVCKEPIGNVSLTPDQAINPGEQANSIVPSRRVLKLLEALHTLHSLHYAWVRGPIGNDHKTALLLSMGGPPPSDLEMFNILLRKFEDAMITYDAGDQEAGLIKLELTDDTITDQMSTRNEDWAGDTVIPRGGPYAGYTVRNAQRDIQVQVWTKMAWMYLEIGGHHVCAARILAHLIIEGPGDPSNYWDLPSVGNKAAMAFYLGAQACDAEGKLGYRPRVRCLREAVDYLRLGLLHEIDDLMLRKEMEEKRDKFVKDLGLLQGKASKGRYLTLEELASL